MKLFILRHGIAVEPEDWKGSELERPLTEKGEKNIREALPAMTAILEDVELAYSSPLARAQKTLDIVASECKFKKILMTEVLSPEKSVKELIEFLNGFSASSVLIVGHQPLLGDFVNGLLDKRGRLLELKKAALVELEIEDLKCGQAELMGFYLNKTLRKVSRR